MFVDRKIVYFGMAHESLKQMRETAERFYLDETIEFLNSLKKESVYQIISQIPTIHQQPCYIKLNKQGEMAMRVTDMKGTPEDPPANYQHIGYGFHRQFLLVQPNRAFNVPFGVRGLSVQFGGQDRFTGTFHEMESKLNSGPFFYRCILPMDNAECPLTYIESLPFNIGGSLRVKGLIKITVAGNQLNIFDFELADKKQYLFIDSTKPGGYVLFKKAVEAFLIHYGWISGNLIRKRMFILLATDAAIRKIQHFSYYKLSESKHGREAIRPRDLIDFVSKETLEKERYLNNLVLSRLIESSLNDPAFLRAATIIAESHGYPLEIRAATYSVALETLKNIIIEQNQSKINPVKNKTIAKQIAKRLKEVVVQFPESNFNNLQLYLQRINQLNQVGNTDSFLKAFELVGLRLTQSDKECLKKRNDFLHGRIPFDPQPEDHQNTELTAVVLRLHLLLCALMLKMAGYSGFMFNNLRFRFLSLHNEPIYRNLTTGEEVFPHI